MIAETSINFLHGNAKRMLATVMAARKRITRIDSLFGSIEILKESLSASPF
jgi:hypothetical protein